MTSYFLVGARCVIAVVFGIAVFGKIRSGDHFRNFAGAIKHLTVMPARFSTPLAVCIVLVESVTVVFLVLPWTFRLGFMLASALLAVFIGIAIRAVLGGAVVECRCFGRSGSVMSMSMILRNLLLLGFTMPGVLLDSGSGAPTYLVLVALAGVGIAVFFTRYYDVVVRMFFRRMAKT